MKKTLLTLLLGAGLFFGGGEKLKAQENPKELKFERFYEDKNADGFNEKKYYFKKNAFGFTFIQYSDEDNNHFYESVKLINSDTYLNSLDINSLRAVELVYLDKKLTNLSRGEIGASNSDIVNCHFIVEQLKINKSTGLINYLFEEYYPEDYNTAVSGNKFNSSKFGETIDADDFPKNSKSHNDLTPQKANSISPDLEIRIKNMVTSIENEEELENFLKQERYFWKDKTENIGGNLEEEINKIKKELEYQRANINNDIVNRLAKKFGTPQQAILTLLCYIGKCDPNEPRYAKLYHQFEKNTIKHIQNVLTPEQFEYLNAIKK